MKKLRGRRSCNCQNQKDKTPLLGPILWKAGVREYSWRDLTHMNLQFMSIKFGTRRVGYLEDVRKLHAKDVKILFE